jgi:hypothetical protein
VLVFFNLPNVIWLIVYNFSREGIMFMIFQTRRLCIKNMLLWFHCVHMSWCFNVPTFWQSFHDVPLMFRINWPLHFHVVPTMFTWCIHFSFVISLWLSYSHVVPFVILRHVVRSFINICEFNGMDFCVSQRAIVYLFYNTQGKIYIITK